MAIAEGTHLWTPSPQFAAASNITRYLDWLALERRLDFAGYGELWRWSVDEPEAFWASLWDFFDVRSETPYRQVLDRRAMPGARWFEGARLNYAERLLAHETADPDGVALHCYSESGPVHRLSWSALGAEVRRLAEWLRARGIASGDRVVSYLPTAPETAVAMLATTAVGAVWSSAAPEFGARTVIDRFAQIEPKLAFVADGYRFAGKEFDRRSVICEIVAGLPTLEEVVWVSRLDPAAAPPALGVSVTSWNEALGGPDLPAAAFRYERVESQHPLWILYSSGTTGLPKAIVHGHAGVLLEHLKTTTFHLNLKPSSCMFFYTTTGWMMWNALIAALLAGSSAVLYDGSPFHPGMERLWSIAADAGVTSFGASPGFVAAMQQAGLRPGHQFDLSKLEGVLLAGAPATPETFAWFYDAVKPDLWVTSQSGGTEFCAGLVGAAPTLPVYAGEIQTRLLGAAIEAWNDAGEPVLDQVGELVVTMPMPSMPICFWNDPDFERYKQTYFDTFPGVWRHGDFIKVNRRSGCYIYGRSDATLNRHGVRIGSAEIYRTVEQIEEVADSLVVCIERPDGGFYMPLFLRLRDGSSLDENLKLRIAARLRSENSPRHVPDEMIAVPAIPYTLTMKKMEVPVRRLLLGHPAGQAYSADAMADPSAMAWYVEFAARASEGR